MKLNTNVSFVSPLNYANCASLVDIMNSMNLFLGHLLIKNGSLHLGRLKSYQLKTILN